MVIQRGTRQGYNLETRLQEGFKKFEGKAACAPQNKTHSRATHSSAPPNLFATLSARERAFLIPGVPWPSQSTLTAMTSLGAH